jgi:hypothetical protein
MLLCSCSARVSRDLIGEKQIAESGLKLKVYSAIKVRDCFYLECGESTFKIQSQWIELEAEKSGKILRYANIVCKDLNKCYDRPNKFILCNSMFVPVYRSEQYQINGQSINGSTCRSSVFIDLR